MCNGENNNCSCFANTLKTIIELQKKGQCIDSTLPSCDRPFLGNTTTGVLYNTRPISLYTCGNSALWTMPYTLDTTTGESSVFRVEAVDGCCATCRVLAPNPDTTSIYPYVTTDSFFTINLNCVGTLTCLQDTYIGCL